MNRRENILRAYRMEHPDWIPASSGLPFLDWERFGYCTEELEDICARHPFLFPGFQKGTLRRNHENVNKTLPDMVENQPYTDYWGCVWETKHTGMVGAVTHHPLADWSAFEHFRAPNPEITDGLRLLDWESLNRYAVRAERADSFFGLGLPHGHTFLRVQDIRGYFNFITDMAEDEPRIRQLLDIVTVFNVSLIKKMIALEPDMISIPEDLGMQNSPLLTPAHFREYIFPCYEKMTRPIVTAGILVHQHSDGFVLPLMDDIIKTGCHIINLQDLVNGIDAIARELKGRIAIDLDIDRQHITVNGSVGDIDSHVRECVQKLSTPAGGLSVVYQPWPPTPAKNMDAVFTAMEKYCVHEYP